MGVLLILGLIWFILRRRKRAKIASPEAQPIVPRADKDDILSHPSVKFGLRSQKTGAAPLPTDGAIRTENTTPVEIDGSMVRAEVDGMAPMTDTSQASPMELPASPVANQEASAGSPTGSPTHNQGRSTSADNI